MTGDIISLFRARLAREQGTIIKDRGGKISIALVYPNLYRIGMSNLGFQVVYHLLNSRSDVVAERAFLPDGQELPLFRQSGKPLLSLETQTPLHDFDLIAFSLSFENDYLNLLKILELAKIPILAENRPFKCPLVMAGGVTTFLNPEPIAPFMDMFLLGEAEALFGPFLDQFKESLFCESRDAQIIQIAQRVPGLYAPSLYHVQYHKDGTLKSFLPNKSTVPEKVKAPRAVNNEIPASVITTPDTEFSDRVLIEMGRGCAHACRFCAAGHVYRPPRVHTKEDLQVAINKALERHPQVGLVAAAVSDIPGINDLTDMIIHQGASFSVSSLRAENLTQRLLNNLKKAGQKTLAIAPEAGSERLRRVINKHLTLEQIVDAIKMISKIEDFSIRLYFLMGLPTETLEDMKEMVDLVKHIRHHMVKESASRGKIGQIKISMNCFVPKPFTPFQWFPLEQVSSLKEKQKWIKKTLSKEGGIKINFDVPKWARIQALLSMGDRRVAAILLKTHELEGHWNQALRFSDINPDFFVYRPKGLDEILPWDFIDHGLHKEHLIKEYNLALKEKESDICHVGKCIRCGVCAKP